MPNPTYVEFPDEDARRIISAGIPFGPRLHECVCGAGRHAHAGDKATGSCKSTGCKRYRADTAVQLAYLALDADLTSLGDALRAYDDMEREEHYAENPRVEGEWSIGASDTGTCPRRIWYRNTPPADMFWSIVDKREARAGTMIHKAITERIKALYYWRQFDLPVQIEGLDRKSEIDDYDPVTGALTDYKTAGKWKWQRVGDFGPPDSEWEQVMLYGLAMEEAGHLVTKVRLTYYNRENGHTEEPFIREWDDDARKIAEAARDRLMSYAGGLDAGVVLPRFEGAHLDHPLCGRCEAREHCWNVPEAQRLGRSPEGLVYLGPKPDDEAIIWAAEQVVETRDARLDAEKAEKAVKDLPKGLPLGRYGQYEIYETGGGSQPDYKSYAGQLESEYVRPDGERRPLEEIPKPAPRKYRYVTVSRVRKSTLEAEAREERKAEKARLAAAKEAAPEPEEPAS